MKIIINGVEAEIGGGAGGLTEEEADGRYLQKSGGEVEEGFSLSARYTGGGSRVYQSGLQLGTDGSAELSAGGDEETAVESSVSVHTDETHEFSGGTAAIVSRRKDGSQSDELYLMPEQTLLSVKDDTGNETCVRMDPVAVELSTGGITVISMDGIQIFALQHEVQINGSPVLTEMSADGAYLRLEGGDMLGPLTVPDPENDTGAASKGYVDAAIQAAISGAIEEAY